MAKKVLVAYASKYGSTREIAEKIGQVITQSGLEAEVLAAEKVKDIAAYQAVVLGSAAYIGNWRKEAITFIRKFDDELEQLPTWIFSSGPLGTGDALQEMKGWKYPASIDPVIERIKPRGITVFHGTVNLKKLSFMERWMMKNMKEAGHDARRWDLIEKWAKEIAGAVSNLSQK
jgi:menaquinone-dependent protoporphyrinogen oxidase